MSCAEQSGSPQGYRADASIGYDGSAEDANAAPGEGGGGVEVTVRSMLFVFMIFKSMSLFF